MQKLNNSCLLCTVIVQKKHIRPQPNPLPRLIGLVGIEPLRHRARAL